MKLQKLSLALTFAVLTTAPSFADSSTWTVDPMHSAAHFTVKHMMVSNVSGDFGKVSGEVKYDGKDLAAASVDATIDANSIDTREPKRDGHVKSPDFLDTVKFPSITFKSTKVVPGKDGFDIHGNLTLHGVTKPVVLHAEPLSAPVKDGHGSVHIGTSATTKINRRDYGVNFNGLLDNGGAMVSDDVKVTIDIDLSRKVDTASSETSIGKKSS
jgi:polyisoprenoid-binding protein YceI